MFICLFVLFNLYFFTIFIRQRHCLSASLLSSSFCFLCFMLLALFICRRHRFYLVVFSFYVFVFVFFFFNVFFYILVVCFSYFTLFLFVSCLFFVYLFYFFTTFICQRHRLSASPC